MYILPDVTPEGIDRAISDFYVGEIPFKYRFNGLLDTIDLTDVVYFESNHREVKAYNENGEYIRFYEKLDDVEKE